ncbi:hypothetical protein LX32DRAFT_643901 [Colletotrichum zoysiae]|uniref:Uncharacterized protein n=1 Tax=Colletotrichum zoysiae TaxID=1216348 RepID=A0AAD9H8L8_9PEZI|nr:hypothetical protein LX32DRAFT_643901 [Colletotrichum zoysiae]
MIFYKAILFQFLFLPFVINAAITVYISVYQVRKEGESNHWAIFLDGPKRVILQLADQETGNGYYVEEPIYNKSPTRARRHLKSYHVGKINSNNKFDYAISTVQSTPISHGSSTWNCQAWSIEALDRLAEAGIFTWEGGKREHLLSLRN